MDERNIDLWFRWTQSPRIEVVVGPEIFLIPRELLRRRSPYFQQEIDEQPLREECQTISLGDLSSQAFTRFYRWVSSETPSISSEISPEELEDLAILAEKYKVFALQHQVADLFHDKFNGRLSYSKWNLQPDMVSRVYQKCGPTSCLRRVFQAALKTVAPQELLGEWEEWSKVAGAGGDLGIDLLKAMVQMQSLQDQGFGWNSQPVKSENPCLFHDHGRQGLPVETMKRVRKRDNTKCLFREEECFSGEFTKEEDQEGAGFKGEKDKNGQPFEESRPDEESGEAFAEAIPEAADAEPAAPTEPELDAATPYDEPAPPKAEPAKSEDLEPVYGWGFPTISKKDKKKKTIQDEPVPEDAEPVNCEDPAAEDVWNFSAKSKKDKKKKRSIWGEPEPPVTLDPPADTAVPRPNSDEWIKLGEERDLTA